MPYMFLSVTNRFIDLVWAGLGHPQIYCSIGSWLLEWAYGYLSVNLRVYSQ